jgi:hypothetical protein
MRETDNQSTEPIAALTSTDGKELDGSQLLHRLISTRL